MGANWIVDNWFYKEAHAFMIANEVWFFQQMADTGYVPQCERVADNVLRTRYLGNQTDSWFSVTNTKEFLNHEHLILDALAAKRIRHGDLTEYAVIVVNNKPLLIDFGESRLWNDPRPDKRPEGDKFWLQHTLQKIYRLSTTQERESIGR